MQDVQWLDLPEQFRAARDARPDDVTILGQRTWRGVRTINHVLDGADVSAVLLKIDIEARSFPWFVTAASNAGANDWGVMGASSCELNFPESITGHLRSAWDCCIGFHGTTAGTLRNVHAVEVEYADGAVYRAELADDNCAIVYAPVQSWDQKDNRVVIWYLNASEGIVHRETYWLGAGLGPPEAAG